MSPRRPAGRHRDGRGRGVKTCGHAFDQGPLAPKGYITGAEYNWTEMFETFVETLQKGGTLPNFVTGGYRQGLYPVEPVRCGCDTGGDQRRQDRHAGDEEPGRNLRRADQGQHRKDRGAGRNDLWTLCRRASADRLSGRGRYRLDQMKEQYIGEKLAFGMVPAVCIGSGADIQSFASVCLLSATIGHRGQRGIAWQRRNQTAPATERNKATGAGQLQK